MFKVGQIVTLKAYPNRVCGKVESIKDDGAVQWGDNYDKNVFYVSRPSDLMLKESVK